MSPLIVTSERQACTVESNKSVAELSALQMEMGSLSLLGGWEAQNGALQTLGIDMFAQAKQASHLPFTSACVT